MILSNAHEDLLALHIQTLVVFLFKFSLSLRQLVVKLNPVRLVALQEGFHLLEPCCQDFDPCCFVH